MVAKGDFIMHKKYFNFILPIFGALAIVGSGFSAWIFSDVAQQTGEVNGTVTLENLSSLESSLTVNPETFALHLDQGGIGNTNVTDGIYFGDDSTAATLDVTLTYTLNPNDAAFGFWDNVTAAYTVAYTLPGDLGEYIAPTDTTLGGDVDMTSYTVDSTTGARTYTVNYTMGFNYATGKKPTDATGYSALEAVVDALTASDKIVATFTFNTTIAE